MNISLPSYAAPKQRITILSHPWRHIESRYFADMKRRQFHQLALAGLPALAHSSKSVAAKPQDDLIKPSKPRLGSKWGLIAPGSPVPKQRIRQAEENVRKLGFVPVVGRHASKEYGFLAGTDEERLDDLLSMFADPDIEAVWCLRGGYGCSRLLPHIDYNLIQANPKPLIGYSDITALHFAFYARCNLLSFHGPISAAQFGPYNQEHLTKTWQADSWTIRPYKEHQNMGVSKTEYRAESLIRGQATGRLIGGNLSLLAALAGTPYSPSYRDKIVFIEDIGELPYRLDRMLVQLRQATDFEDAAGYVLGVFKDCKPESSDRSLGLKETLAGQFMPLGKPMAYGLPFGHVEEQVTLPQGAQAHFNAGTMELTILETPFA